MQQRMRKQDSSLLCAVQRSNPSCVRKLIASRADVNAFDADGLTPLMKAASKGRTGIVRLLLKHGAESSAVATYLDHNWQSAISLAARGGHLNVIRILLARKDNQIVCSRWFRSDRLYRIYLNKVRRNEWQDHESQPFLRFVALTEAIRGKQPAAVAMLRPYGDYGLKDRNIGTNWLVFAAEYGDADSIQVYLDLGVGIDTLADWGQEETALITAAKNGDVAIVRLLLSRGADVYAKTEAGYSVFDVLIPPPEPLKAVCAFLYERLLSLQPAYEEIRSLLHEHTAKLEREQTGGYIEQ